MSQNMERRPGVTTPEAPQAPESAATHSTATPVDVAMVGHDRGACTQVCLTWEQVLGAISTPAQAGSKEGAGAWVFGTFTDGKRDKAHLVSRSALTADLDHNVDLGAVQASLEALGAAYAWHTTYSSTPEAPRLRIVVPLSHAVTEAEYWRLSHLLWECLGVQADTSSDQASRIMYMPNTPNPDTYQWGAGGTAPADVDAWLASAPQVQPPAPVLAPRGVPVRREYVQAQLERLKGRLAEASTWPDEHTDEDGKGWDDLVATAAFMVAGLTVTTDEDGRVHLDPTEAEPLFEDLVPECMRNAEAVGGGVLGGKLALKLRNPQPWPAPAPSGPEAFGLNPPAVQAPPAAGGVVDSGNGLAATLHVQNRVAYGLAATQAGRHMHVASVGWHHWDGARWCRDEDAVRIHQAVRRHLGDLAAAAHQAEDEAKRVAALKSLAQASSASGQDGVVRIARTLPEFAAVASDLDGDPWLLNVANGTLNLRTLELQPHDPSDRITKVTRANYVPGLDWRSSRWGSFLGEVLPNAQVQQFVQQFVGQALVGKPMEHLMLVMTGEGRNGKGVLYKALGHALGDYAGAAEPQLLVSKDRGSAGVAAGQMALRGLRWVVTSELEDGDSLSVAITKRITGGDPITAKYMGQNWVTFDPSHTVCMVTNHLPSATASDPALWERIRVVPFDVVVPPEARDVHLDEKLNAEADAVLAWAVDGLHQYLAGGLTEPAEVTRATAEYRDENDRVRRFVDEELEATDTPASTTTDLHRLYASWCLADGATPDGRKAFSKQLQRLGHQSRSTNRGPCYMLKPRVRVGHPGMAML